jgi:thiol:disulfide interchange protein DsbA
MFHRTAQLRAFVLLGALVLTAACSAANSPASSGAPASNAATAGVAAPYTEGNQYVALPVPNQRLSRDGKVEVVEVFSYGCIHCAEFSITADQLRKSLPQGVVFKLIPAAFNDQWIPFARAYYAAKKLGLVDKTHIALFKAKFVDHYPIGSMDELADFYAQHGADRAEFLRIANSAEVTAQMASDAALIQKWGVDGTPTIVVDGKYRSANITSFDELAAMAQWLAQRELSEAGKSGH